jgi:hypothetical protein
MMACKVTDAKAASYVEHIRATLPTRVELPPQPKDREILRVDSAAVLASALTGRPSDCLAFEFPPHVAKTVDAAGHDRPYYPGLAFYCWARALRVARPAADDPLHDQWRQTLTRVRSNTLANAEEFGIDPPAGPFPARLGMTLAGAAWGALALAALEALEGDWPFDRLAERFFARLIKHQARSGPFLQFTSSDNPETFWFQELVLLHAAASFAALSGDADVTAAVTRHTEWVQNETQPDHATNEPWGLHAFMRNSYTHPLADQLLHTVRTLHPAGATGVSLMLLADALYCLRPPAANGPGAHATDPNGKAQPP